MSRVPEPHADGLRRYGFRHAQRAEDTTRCAAEVYGRERWPTAHQCNKPRGHGPDGLYCKVHDPEAVNKRRADSEAKWHARMNRETRPQRLMMAYREALQKIADGHNDPRAVAAEALEAD